MAGDTEAGGMNIYEATRFAIDKGLWIRKADRTEEWCLRVALGKVYRKRSGEEVELDARDCLGEDWYCVDDKGEVIAE